MPPALAGEAGDGELVMQQLMVRFFREQDAQDLIEYALLCALLALACITGILGLTRIKEFFAAAGAALNSAI